MMIRHKGIHHERMADAPFTGALICAVDCRIGCKGCFNQHLKEEDYVEESIGSILEEVKSHLFNNGIILAGLEWSLQPRELMALTRAAVSQGLQVIIYTGYNKDVFVKRVPEILTIKGPIFIKHGAYDENRLAERHVQYGVKLASDNQQIETLKAFAIRRHLNIINKEEII